ncbi:hypothetical protein, partial [Treponema pallidum]
MAHGKSAFFTTDAFVAISVLVVVFSIVVPLPTQILDALMAFNLIFNLLILLMVL